MGRRYYCDYCEKSFVETPDALKKHRNGLLHQKLLKEHYNNFKDKETIIREESGKNPCNRFLKTGECGFGSTCRYSHYTQEQLNYMRWEVQQSQASSHSDPTFGNNPPTLETWFLSRRQRGLKDSPALSELFTSSLPLLNTQTSKNISGTHPEDMINISDIPSLRKINASDLENFSFASWG